MLFQQDPLNCNYCGELDDLTHIFVASRRLSGFFQLTKSLNNKLTPAIDKIPVWWYIIGIPTSAGLDIHVIPMGNCIVAQAKLLLFIVDTAETGVVGLIV